MDHTMTDKVLLDRLSGGDEGALNDIYLLYWEGLFLSAFNVLKDKATCEDIIQELFLQLWQKRAQLQINTSLSAYLYTAVRYNVFRVIRTGKVRKALFQHIDERIEGLAVEQLAHVEEREIHQKLAQAVAALPEKCREVYILSREEELSHKEIASKLNISTKTVENQITIALKRVRSSLNTLSVFISSCMVLISQMTSL